jgi:2'-5' RNA ligase
VAIGLSGAIKGRLEAAMDRSVRGIRWVAADQLHLTLKFLGEVPEPKVAGIVEALRRIRRAPFDLSVEGTGVFPERGPARVLWAGCVGDAAELAEEVERALGPLGFPREERPFAAHVTIGRVKHPRAAREVRLDPAALFGRQRVASFSLMKSELRPAGPVYAEVAAFTLTP